eukprot:TRINITY_DN11679_c0_g1_i1.p1 TRINITY_DN11679_c0_g1~~TRINITY_DN11679_c0_g1_i1.p1  ORF type:complete len:337 (-),score=97.97 TRINITY_DN11679_c0_g1_i1:85-1095(-)
MFASPNPKASSVSAKTPTSFKTVKTENKEPFPFEPPVSLQHFTAFLNRGCREVACSYDLGSQRSFWICDIPTFTWLGANGILAESPRKVAASSRSFDRGDRPNQNLMFHFPSGLCISEKQLSEDLDQWRRYNIPPRYVVDTDMTDIKQNLCWLKDDLTLMTQGAIENAEKHIKEINKTMNADFRRRFNAEEKPSGDTEMIRAELESLRSENERLVAEIAGVQAELFHARDALEKAESGRHENELLYAQTLVEANHTTALLKTREQMLAEYAYQETELLKANEALKIEAERLNKKFAKKANKMRHLVQVLQAASDAAGEEDDDLDAEFALAEKLVIA